MGLERWVAREGIEQPVAQHLDLALRAVASVELDRAVRGVQGRVGLEGGWRVLAHGVLEGGQEGGGAFGGGRCARGVRVR